MKVLASPFVPNSPLTPKSQSFTWPLRHRRMLEGLMSACVSDKSSQNEVSSLPRCIIF